MNEPNKKNRLYYGHPEPNLLPNAVKEAQGLTGSYVILVPDPFKLETEQEIGEISGVPLLHVKVMSFQRLAKRIVREEFTPISRTGRQMFLTGILAKNKDRMRVFSRHSNKQSFISGLSAVLSEMDAPVVFSGIAGTDDHAADAVLSPLSRRRLEDKIHDLNLLYASYQNISGKYIGDEKLIGYAAAVAEHSPFVKESKFYITKYSSLSENEWKLFRSLCGHARGVEVSLNYKAEDSPSVFDYTGRLLRRMNREIEIVSWDLPEKDSVFSDISRRIFRQEVRELSTLFAGALNLVSEEDGKSGGILQYNNSPVEVYEAKQPYDEVMFAADKILELIQSGVSLSEITVLCPDFEVYSGLAERIFSRRRIPFFVDGKRSFSHHPLAEFVEGLLLYQDGRSEEAKRKMLLSGVFPMEEGEVLREQVRQLEKRAAGERLCGILDVLDMRELGARFAVRDFVRTLYRVLTTVFEPADGGDSVAAEMEDGLAAEGTSGCSVMSKCIEHSRGMIGSVGEVVSEADYGVKIWNDFVEILDELDELSDIMEPIDFGVARVTLSGAFRELSISRIPEYLEFVSVAPLDRVRVARARHCFVLGAVRGELPRHRFDTSVFSLDEQNMLLTSPEATRFSQFADLEREAFRLHLLLTTPQERIYFTYPSGARSVVLNILHEAFSLLFEGKRVLFPTVAMCAGGSGKHDFTKVQTKLTEGFSFVDLSPSTLERYLSCPFQYFMNKILYVRDMEVNEVNAKTSGTVIHRILEKYVNLYIMPERSDCSDRSSRSDHRDCSDHSEPSDRSGGEDDFEMIRHLEDSGDRIRQRITAIFELVKREFPFPELDQPMFAARFIDACTFYAQVVEFQMAMGDFKVDGTEKLISVEHTFSGNFFSDFMQDMPELQEFMVGIDDDFGGGAPFTVRLSGSIDRIDRARAGDGEYYRIVDYKTGKKSASVFDLLDLKYVQLGQYFYAMHILNLEADCIGLPLLQSNDREAKKAFAMSKNTLPPFAFMPMLGSNLDAEYARRLSCRDSALEPHVISDGKGRFFCKDDEAFSIQREAAAAAVAEWFKAHQDAPPSVDMVHCVSDALRACLEQKEKLDIRMVALFSKLLLWIAAKGISEGYFDVIAEKKRCAYCSYKAVCRIGAAVAGEEDDEE